MNVQDYISSGIIESYVLGLASAEERARFEQYCQQYPALVTARNAFEIALEKQCQEHAVPPPAELKTKVLEAIRHQSPEEKTKVATMTTPATRSASPLRWAVAAAIILLLAASVFAYQFYTENKKLRARIDSMNGEMDEVALERKIMYDPNLLAVNMSPLPKAAPSSAIIYWDSTAASVYMIVKNMPQLPSDKQYQLWALINGQPKDLGLFDVDATGKKVLKMNNVQKADAFAITIEDRGNKGGPTPERMQTMGKPAKPI